MPNLDMYASICLHGDGCFNGPGHSTSDSNPSGHTSQLYFPDLQPKGPAGHQPTSSSRLANKRKERCYQTLSQLENLEQRIGLIPKQLLVWKVLERNEKDLRPPREAAEGCLIHGSEFRLCWRPASNHSVFWWG